MAVVIWKDGEKVLCPPHRLQRNLDAGWSLTKKPARKARKKAVDPVETIDLPILELSNEAEQSD